MQTLEKEKDRQNTDPIPEDTGTASQQPTGEEEQPSQQVPEQKESPNPPETSPQTPEAGQTEDASQPEQPEDSPVPSFPVGRDGDDVGRRGHEQPGKGSLCQEHDSHVGVLPGHGTEVAQGIVYVGTRFVVGYQVGSLLYEGSVPVNITLRLSFSSFSALAYAPPTRLCTYLLPIIGRKPPTVSA